MLATIPCRISAEVMTADGSGSGCAGASATILQSQVFVYRKDCKIALELRT